MDEFGLILHSNITALTSVTGKEVIGTYAADYLSAKESGEYLAKIQKCLKTGSEAYTFTLQGKTWLAKLDMISDRRVRATHVCVDGMNIHDVVNLL